MNITTWYKNPATLAEMLHSRRESIESCIGAFLSVINGNYSVYDVRVWEMVRESINIELSEYNDYVTGVL